MERGKYVVLTFLVILLIFSFSCSAGKAERKVRKTGADQIDIYVGEEPTRPYKKINFVTYSHSQAPYCYNMFLIRAKEMGADGIILIETPGFIIKGGEEVVKEQTRTHGGPFRRVIYSGIAIKYTD